MLQIQLLGTFAVQSERGLVGADLGAIGRRLAAYLFSFPNRVHRRERLVDLFRPDVDPVHARAAFSTALWKFRRLLSEERRSQLAVRTTPHEILLEIADLAVVDAHHFRSAILDAFSANGRSPDFEALDRAAALYAGPFLEEYDEDWILEQRERLHTLYIRTLTYLMGWLARQEKYEDAILCGRRILASDPMRETVQRAVMLLYVLNGQRGEAIRQFDRCKRVLRVECDVEPMPETCALCKTIRSGEIFNKLSHVSETMFASLAQDRIPISFL
jgi:DNA-binding SARP family transcriptional activator